MRALLDRERASIKTLAGRAIDFALIEPTKTGLKKSILDATGPVRTFLMSEDLHDFDQQAQGPLHKRMLKASFVGKSGVEPSVASLYRPMTKKGDPRIWFRGLGMFASPNDILALVSMDQELFVLNITTDNLQLLLAKGVGPVSDLVDELETRSGAVASDLLARLRKIAEAGPLESVMTEYADTAVGRTIEHALGIAMNSRSEPDFNGIELKSRRIRKSGTKHTLFAKVPDWNVSNLKSSAEILDSFGYPTERDFRLYCTVSSRKPNPQSLFLKLERGVGLLHEKSSRPAKRDVASWQLTALQKVLSEKHAETFWISVSSDKSGPRELFQIREVEHTRSPIMSQFELLLDQGHITVDHLIKRNRKGRVTEGGPLFKVSRKSFPLLFPPSVKHRLA